MSARKRFFPPSECIVEFKLILESDGKIADDGGNDPDYGGRVQRYVAGGGRDCCETRH
jgi:hypothetical protein